MIAHIFPISGEFRPHLW